MKLYKLNMLVLFLIIGFSSQAQTIEKSVIGSMGLETARISSTAGEVAVDDLNNGVFQGYHHINVTPVGVRDLFIADNALLVYPNPAHEILNVQTPYEIKALEILNISGTLMIKETANFNQINISNLSPGTYVLRMMTSEGMGIRKFIKQ